MIRITYPPIVFILLLLASGCSSPEGPSIIEPQSIELRLADSAVYVGDTVVAWISIDNKLRDKVASIDWSVNGVRLEGGDSLIQFVAEITGSLKVQVEVMGSNNQALARDSAVVEVAAEPAFKIKITDGGETFAQTSFEVSIHKPRASTRYLWTFGDGSLDTTTTPVGSYTYYVPQTYTVTCTAFDSADNLQLGSDTLQISIASPSINLDWNILRSFTKVEILFIGRSTGDWWEPGNSGKDMRTLYGLTLPLNDGVLGWNDTGATYSLGNAERDTVDSGGQTIYGYEERTQRVNISITASRLRSAYLRKLDNHGFSGGGYSSMHKSINEFKVTDFALVHQSSDSIVFAMGSEALKAHFYMYSEDSDTESPNPNFNSGRIYRSTDFKSLSPRPLCTVRFFR